VARLTNSVTDSSLRSTKRTKIIATIGPATDNYETIVSLIKAGANGLRLNFSYGSYSERSKQIGWIRKAAKVCDKPVAIIQDLQGPKLRLGDFDGIITVRKNQTLAFEYGCTYQEGGNIPVQHDFSKKVSRGQRLSLYNGKVRARITAIDGKIIYVRADSDGILIKHKGINLPDTDFAGDVITEKDRQDLVFGSEHDIDYVAMSFVHDSADIDNLKRLLKNLGSPAKVIAKIETKTAVDNLEEIFAASDCVIVDRDNLAVETEAESVPLVQRRAVGLGLYYAKPTIITMHMLAAITETPEPSTAEAADVTAAVLTGADCLMLSDETADGRYPVEAVTVMRRIVRYTESNTPLEVVYPGAHSGQTRQNAISNAIIDLASDIGAVAIVAQTKSGATVKQIASKRPALPLIAVTSNQRIAQQLAIVYGVKSYIRSIDPQAALKLTTWLRSHKVLHKGDIVVLVSGRYPGVVGTTDTIKVRMLE
jgi:pyruvate kinase